MRIQGFGDQKLNGKKLKAEKKLTFFYQKLQFTYDLASIKDVQVQATGEVFIPRKRDLALQNLKFLHFCGSFWPSWIQFRVPNADQDPASQRECGSGSGSAALDACI
jgi:hypothetical protein